jgi:hypothetical protein
LYAKSSKKKTAEDDDFSCGTKEEKEDNKVEESSSHGRDLYDGTYLGATLRIAVVANTEYSAFSGDTVASVAK